MSDFVYTTSIKKLRKLKRRTKVVPGGTSAGKTFGILPILIDKAIKTPNLEISVVSESIPHLRKGALKDFLKIMKITGRYVDAHYNKTLLTYSLPNGSYIEFFSADQEDKVRGPRRHVLYINESNNLKFETYHQLAIRTSNEIWLDFNPSNEFWAHEELTNDEDAEWLTLTYKDNEALPVTIVKEIEKAKVKAFFNPEAKDLFADSNVKNKYWANWWKVYGLGQLGVLDGIIFQDWEIIDNIPSEAKYVRSGMDFGYTNDPTTCVDKYLYNNLPVYDLVLYQKGLINSEIASLVKQDGLKRQIIADSAEPKSIKELNNYGLTVKGAEKGRDSIVFGIQAIQQSKFYVTKRSVELINELRKYCWDVDKNGTKLNSPIDAFNHCIDAIRYLENTERMKPSIKVRTSGTASFKDYYK